MPAGCPKQLHGAWRAWHAPLLQQLTARTVACQAYMSCAWPCTSPMLLGCHVIWGLPPTAGREGFVQGMHSRPGTYRVVVRQAAESWSGALAGAS
jgi:hypothetical protein